MRNPETRLAQIQRQSQIKWTIVFLPYHNYRDRGLLYADFETWKKSILCFGGLLGPGWSRAMECLILSQ